MDTTTLEAPTRNGESLRYSSAILCVDDEPAILSALERSLRREPYEVLTARSGAQALDMLRTHPIKVIITDERMPEMFGSDLLARVRDRLPHVGRIILTGYPGPAVMIRSIETDSDVLISKPWDDEMLKKTIRRLVYEADRDAEPRLEFDERQVREDRAEREERDLGGEGG